VIGPTAATPSPGRGVIASCGTHAAKKGRWWGSSASAIAATTALPGRSFLIDGEAIITNGDGRAVFELIQHKRHGADAVLVAFDLIELGGHDSRRDDWAP
jgi:ATP-dependent DNA ligase